MAATGNTKKLDAELVVGRMAFLRSLFQPRSGGRPSEMAVEKVERVKKVKRVEKVKRVKRVKKLKRVKKVKRVERVERVRDGCNYTHARIIKCEG